MTDREFTVEIRRGIIIILRACVLRFGLSWDWFQPREPVIYNVPRDASRTASVSVLGIDRT